MASWWTRIVKGISKMSKSHILGCVIGLVALLLLIGLDRSSRKSRVQSADPLEGTLYRAEIPELVKADPPLPEPPPSIQLIPAVSVSQSNLAQLGLKIS